MEQEMDDQAWVNKFHKYIDMYLKSEGGSIADWDLENPKKLAELRTKTQSYTNKFMILEEAKLLEDEFTPPFSVWMNRNNEAAVGYLMAMPDMPSAAKAELYGMMNRRFKAEEKDELDSEIVSLIKKDRPDIGKEELTQILDKVRLGYWSLDPTPAQKAAGWLDMQNPYGEGQLGEGQTVLFEQFRNLIGSEEIYIPGTPDVVPALKHLAPNLYQHLTRPDVTEATMAAQLATQTDTLMLGELARVLAETNPIAYARVMAKYPPVARAVGRTQGDEAAIRQALNDTGTPSDDNADGSADGSADDADKAGAKTEEGPTTYGGKIRSGVSGFLEDSIGLGPWTAAAASQIPGAFGNAADTVAYGIDKTSRMQNFLGEKFLGDLFASTPEDSGTFRKAVGIVDPTKVPRAAWGHWFGGPETETAEEADVLPVVPPAVPTESPDYGSQPPRMGVGEEGMPAPLPEEPLSGMPSTARPRTFSDRLREFSRQLS
jgi:hypothetical protein